jgi:hypothetical protein
MSDVCVAPARALCHVDHYVDHFGVGWSNIMQPGNLMRALVNTKQRSILRLSVAAVVVAGGGQLAFAGPASLPPVQHSGDMTYLSGGIGSDESAAIKNVMRNYPLVLEFVGKTTAGNEYLADVPVQIDDVHGMALLDTNSQGPFMFVSLPNGRYTVTASYKGNRQHRVVNVAPAAHAHEMFVWPM